MLGFFFWFSMGCSGQFMRILTNPRSQWESVAGHRMLQLLRLKLESKSNRTPESYPVEDKPLGHTWWFFIMLGYYFKRLYLIDFFSCLFICKKTHFFS